MPAVTDDEYERLDGLDIARGIRQRRFSALEIIDCAIARAEKLNPALNAITWQTFDRARDLASRLDQGLDESTAPLAGVPFLFKDLSCVAGMPQTAHSKLFEGRIADRDAQIVSAFRKAGLNSLGKTNTPELCLTITTESVVAGPCRNPWNTDFSTGGSSGGSAAAVAAGFVPIAHATDGGGSIRIPAACCGLVGHKPSRGLTPSEPDLGSNWSGMSVGHVLTRSVRDSAAVLDNIRLTAPLLYPLPESPDSFLAEIDRPQTYRIAIHDTHPNGMKLDDEVSRALSACARLLESLGHSLEIAAPPIDYEALGRFTGSIIFLHVAQTILPGLESRGVGLDSPLIEEVTRRMAKRGAELSALDYLTAMDGLYSIAMEMADFHRQYDIVLSPVLTRPPAPLGWLDANSPDIRTYAERFSSYSGFCSLYNATGQPSIAVPVAESGDGLPIGMMLSAAWGEDASLFNLARQLEVELQWEQRRPRKST